jgi:hypothetical protein
MLDGNFQLNQMMKDSDPDDISLFCGKGHFPEHSVLEHYLAVAKSKAQVCHNGVPSPCTHIDECSYRNPTA